MTEQTETEEQKPKGKLTLSRPGRLELNKTIKALRDAGATDSEIRIAFGDLMSRRGN